MPHFGRFDMTQAVLQAPATVNVGVSPFTYTAPSDGLVVLSGGTVSLVQYGRAATLTALGLLGGLLPVLKGDTVRVTWAISPPTMTFIPGRAQ